MSDFLSFRIPDQVLSAYRGREPEWGFPCGGGNSLGEIAYMRSYSRLKPDGAKERWFDTCRRVVEGTYSIQKDHCADNQLPWDDGQATESAHEMFELLFNFRWTPPGRGLWMMGTPFVHERKNSVALQNCAFISTDDMVHATYFLMEASMVGVGVGFDTAAAGTETITAPYGAREVVIPDTREGWAHSARMLVDAYLRGGPHPEFNYDEIRAHGAPIKGFGGVASGPGPLKRLHDDIRLLFEGREGEYVTSRDTVDLMNFIGRCVIAGNVRRTAEIAIGSPEDQTFMDLKDWDENPERNDPDTGWGWVSNNSIRAEVGQVDYDEISDRVIKTGEPGILWMDVAGGYGRLKDGPKTDDTRVRGVNPCGEQVLESGELCTLVETFPTRHGSLDEYVRTLKFAYMYGKTVTLLPTHWPKTNAIMQRNRRIGTSMSGIAQFAEDRGPHQLKRWMDAGYEEIQRRDRQYSEWLTVRESVRTTSVKPSGTVSLLAGVTPGVHYQPGGGSYLRRIRFSRDNPIALAADLAGYPMEPVQNDDSQVVVEFPVDGPDVRHEGEVSVWEKAKLAAAAQRHWADNSVSCTLTFSEAERSQLPSLLASYEGELKAVSMLPMATGTYAQAPYEPRDPDEIATRQADVDRMDVDALYAGQAPDAEGARYCTTDKCEIM